MFKTSSSMKGTTLISVLQGSFLTAQSWGLCREGLMGEGNKGAWTVMAHQDLPRLRAIKLPSQTTAKQTHYTAVWVFLCATGCHHIDTDSTSVTLLQNPRLLPHSLSFHSQTIITQHGLISGQQGNETICSWISHLNHPEAENSAAVGTLKVGFLASISKYAN